MKILDKIAAVIVSLLLYFVIAVLQMPKTAHAAETYSLPASRDTSARVDSLAVCRHSGERNCRRQA